jgi:hypothetical protein
VALVAEHVVEFGDEVGGVHVQAPGDLDQGGDGPVVKVRAVVAVQVVGVDAEQVAHLPQR